MVKIAIIRIRGLCKVRGDITSAMDMIGLKKKNTCVIVTETPELRGLLLKIKDYTTFGEVSDETLALLEEKRGKTSVKNDYKTVYFLAPPKGGFEGVKRPFTMKGALGNRAEKINDLIVKMV